MSGGTRLVFLRAAKSSPSIVGRRVFSFLLWETGLGFWGWFFGGEFSDKKISKKKFFGPRKRFCPKI